MSTLVTEAGPDVTPVRGGWRVQRPDGTARTVLQRQSGEGFAVFDGTSTDALRNPPLGYSGSWHHIADDAVAWAREAS